MFDNAAYNIIVFDWMRENIELSLYCNESLDWLKSDKETFECSRLEEISMGSSYLWI
jgi:hypothetical protein